MALGCELPGRLFRKCGKPAVGVCRWCGRPYCSEHQSAIAGISKHPVCRAESCTTRTAVTITANAARQRAEVPNREGLCGLPTCGNKLPGATCRICGAEYCPSHLSARLFRVVEPSNRNGKEAKSTPKQERFFICDQCIDLVKRYGVVELPIELDV